MPETTPDIDAMDAVLAVLDELAQQSNRRTLEHPNGVTVLEEQVWGQGNWRSIFDEGLQPLADAAPTCGTAMCFAGWLAELDPSVQWLATPRGVYEARLAEVQTRTVLRQARGTEDEADAKRAFYLARDRVSGLLTRPDVVVVEGGAQIGVGEWATERLGLVESQADALFGGSNSLEDLRRIVDRLREDPEAYVTVAVDVFEDAEDIYPDEDPDWNG